VMKKTSCWEPLLTSLTKAWCTVTGMWVVAEVRENLRTTFWW